MASPVMEPASHPSIPRAMRVTLLTSENRSTSNAQASLAVGQTGSGVSCVSLSAVLSSERLGGVTHCARPQGLVVKDTSTAPVPQIPTPTLFIMSFLGGRVLRTEPGSCVHQACAPAPSLTLGSAFFRGWGGGGETGLELTL